MLIGLCVKSLICVGRVMISGIKNKNMKSKRENLERFHSDRAKARARAVKRKAEMQRLSIEIESLSRAMDLQILHARSLNTECHKLIDNLHSDMDQIKKNKKSQVMEKSKFEKPKVRFDSRYKYRSGV